MHARLNQCKRKREARSLWETSLGTVISNLSTQHTDEFVKMVLTDSVLRTRLTEELLRRAQHVPDLGDSDLVEFVTLPVRENDLDDGHTATHCLKYCTVGNLPYWLNAALKTQFKSRCGKGAQLSRDPGEGDITQDGRLEFVLREDDTDETTLPLVNAYLDYLAQLGVQECIPSKEDIGYPDAIDDVDLSDVAPGVQPDTALYDAWDMNVNDARDRIQDDIEERMGELFLLHAPPQNWTLEIKKLNNAMVGVGESRVATVWVRKPRVRFVLHPC